MLPKIKRLFRRGFRVLSRTAETVPSGNKDNLPSGNKEPSPPGNKEHHSQSTPKVGQQQLSSHSIERWLENVIPLLPPINRVRPEVDNIDFHIDFSKRSESVQRTWSDCDHCPKTGSPPDDTEPEQLVKRFKLKPEGSVTERKPSVDTNISGDNKWDSDPPTSPEYEITSASDGDDSDTSDSPSSPCAKRVKRAALHTSAKDGRSLKPKAKKARKKKRTADSDWSMSQPSDLDYDSEEEYFIPARGRDDELLNNKLTRERAKRLLDAVELPQGHDLSPDEQRTAHQLLTRGCMPTIHRHWEKDFSTLPESLFFSGKDDEIERNESHFVLENDKCSEFYAIRAFQEILKICGNVRDYCNILDIGPGIYIKKSIEKYLRWALSDAGVRVQPDTPPVHIIYCQNQDEEPKEAFNKVAKAFEKLSNAWQSLLATPDDSEVAWPALIGLVLCGPVLSVISLDTNPHPQTLTQGIKFLGHFDLSDFDNDVWNTLAVAIIVMHIKRTVTKLAKAYNDKLVASIFDGPAMGSPDPDR